MFNNSLLSVAEGVYRFGKLFLLSISKSFPFWKTLIGCKDTKNTKYETNYLSKKTLKNEFYKKR